MNMSVRHFLFRRRRQVGGVVALAGVAAFSGRASCGLDDLPETGERGHLTS